MPHRISDYVLSGELRNTRRNSVTGWIEFAPDYGIRLELTGNFSGQLNGQHIRFKNRLLDPEQVSAPGEFPDPIEELADRQIGVVQSMQLRDASSPPAENALALSAAERESKSGNLPGLWLEWSSQNGDVQCELMDVELEYVDPDQTTPDESNYEAYSPESYADGLTELTLHEHVDSESDELFATHEEEGSDPELADDELDDAEDPYGLFDDRLQADVEQALAGDSATAADARPGWDEIIPDIDPQTKALYEQWDEIFEGKKDEPIRHLFPKPLKLPKPERVASDEEAEKLVKDILSQLALLSVALDVCEHFSPQQTYRLLIQEILPSAKVHPNLAASDMVQHYATSDYCQRCEEEFEAEYEDGQKDDADDQGDDDGSVS